jgi:hypothetical protein
LHGILTDENHDSGYEVKGDEYDYDDTDQFSSYATDTSTTTRVSTFNLDISGVPYTTNKVYLWVYANCTVRGRYAQYTTIDLTLTEGDPITLAPEKTNVRTGSITTTTGQFFKPTQTIRVSWSQGSNGTGTTITGYKARIGYTKDDGSAINITLNDQTSNLYADIPVSDIPRGKKIRAGVKAFGSGGYDGNWVDTEIGSINN